jgi:RNA-directed DNA polymerase
MLSPYLDRISNISKSGRRVENLAHLIEEEALRQAHQEMDGKKTAGIDGVTKQSYQSNLEQNISGLVSRMKKGSYHPHSARRVYIDKPGSNKKRPLGISCYEDKLVEKVMAVLLTAVYEPKFQDCSYGFRPGRNCHMAVREVIRRIQGYTNYVVEADIRSFFDRLSHEWLIKFLEHDIADRKFIDIIRKFLKAGIMEGKEWRESLEGSPQGNAASPILANVYLHYVLDTWFEAGVKKCCKGEAWLIRYADDFTCCFQYWDDAKRFLCSLRARFEKFGLELAEEKTRILQFGRYATATRAKNGLGKPETFDFLGFTFYCGLSRKGNYTPKVRSSRKKLSSKLKKLNEWMKANRHLPVKEIIKRINLALTGHYRYYGVTDNTASMKNFLMRVTDILYKWLNRRNQRRSYNWNTFRYGLLKTLPLNTPKIFVNLYYGMRNYFLCDKEDVVVIYLICII